MGFTSLDAFGVVGLVTLLSGFLLNLMGRLAADTYAYSTLNFVGSGILAVYAYLLQSWVFLPLEIVWSLAALVVLVKKALRRPSPANS